MSRSRGIGRFLTVALLFIASAFADDQALWREYGLVHTQTSKQGKLTITAYEMKDVTGALAAWEWLRSPTGRSCDLAPFCTRDEKEIVVSDDNYVVAFQGGVPSPKQAHSVMTQLPNKHEASLPAILTFIPKRGLLPDSARYVLGSASLHAFAPEFASTNVGLNEGAEAQIAEYKLHGGRAPVHLALFYYPAPEMARLCAAKFKLIPNTYVKRSAVLVAIVYGNATREQADALLNQVQYEAKITWNDVPPPPPIKPLLQLLMNIMWMSLILAGIGLTAGLMYAGMRLYRRKYGTLEADESLTTLHLTRE